MRQLTMGSLFDGIGGFPLAATHAGIEPVWASEIEPFPIEVTKLHFPNMLHVGDITKLNGALLPPVDIICGGSPCQDLSVAGARAGLSGERSGLFMEQIRIIKEMRNADKSRGRAGIAVRPRFCVWENVPGAFSSAGGEDFRAVLQSFIQIEEPQMDVVRPPAGRWEYAGAVLGVRSCVAWVTWDAQYFGVPQRRKRIFLVTDFAGYSPIQILFDQDRLLGNPAPGGGARQTTYYYRSDTLIAGLQNALSANATTVKNALELYVTNNGGTAMTATDANGHSAASDLPLGLYLFVETSVPEMVTSTTAPFLISIPMTSTTASGSSWIYDITVYPKNLTGLPTLDKTVREAKTSSGKNNGSAAINDGYAESATASAGDTVEYQIISTLPSITSAASYLSQYTFVDTLSTGLTYKKNDVVLEFYSEAACTNKIATWTADSEKFTVGYTTGTNGESIMTIAMTAAGLTEINTSSAVYTGASAVNSGYSDCTLRITYAATLDTDNSLVLGDTGNPNEVTLTWKRSNTSFYDTLTDDAAVYSFGLDVTKNFSDGRGDATKVEFLIQNSTDNYYLTGSLNTTENVWYVTGKTADASGATHFVPTAAGKLTVKGLEDDAYTLTEVKTDSAYTLLKAPVQVVVSKSGSTVTATVDGNAVNMSAVGTSAHALVPFTIINTRGFDLPQTGGTGNWMFPVIGMVMLAACVTGIVILLKKKPAQE